MISNFKFETNSVPVILCVGGIILILLSIFIQIWLFIIGFFLLFIGIILSLIENQQLDKIFNPKKQTRRELVNSCYKIIQDKNYDIYKDFKLTKEYIALRPYFSKSVVEYVEHKRNQLFGMVDGDKGEYIRKVILEDLAKLEKKWHL